MEIPRVVCKCCYASHINVVVVAKVRLFVFHGFGVAIGIYIVEVVDTHPRYIGSGHLYIFGQVVDIAVGEWVDVVPLVAAHQVVDGFVVTPFRIFSLQTSHNVQVVEGFVFVCGIECSLKNVVVTTFLHIFCHAIWIDDVVHGIGVVHGIPIHLCVCITFFAVTFFPNVGQVFVSIYVRQNFALVATFPILRAAAHAVVVVVVEFAIVCKSPASQLVARQIAVVVGTRVWCVVERDSRVAIHAVVCAKTEFQGLSFGNFPIVVEQQGWIVTMYNARVAFFAVVPAPIGIVGCGGQVYSFLRQSRRASAFGWSAPCGNVQAVVVVKHLFGTEEERTSVVECAFVASKECGIVHILVAPAIRTAHRECPAVGHQASGVGCLSAQPIRTVRCRNAYIAAASIFRCANVYISGVAQIAVGIRVWRKVVDQLFVAESVVQAANRRIVEPSALTIVEVYTIYICAFVALLVAAYAVARCTETITCGACEYIAFREKQARNGL